jgi:phage terminase large subunit-like protein
MNVIQFADDNIKLNEKGKPWTWSQYQRDVLTLAYQRHYSIRLWSEVKKSGKTFLAAVIAVWEAITNADAEVVCCANDEEQALSRVFQTCCQLIKYNAELSASATVQASQIKFTNGSVIRAVSSDYKGQAGGRQRLTIFDELWAYDSERATRLFEEMTPPPTEEGAYLLIVSYAGFTSEGELLENLYNRGLKGRRAHKSLECYRAQGLFMFWSHKRRQPWQLGPEGKAYYDEQRRILRPNTFARIHKNEWVSAESAFIGAEQWDAITDPTLLPSLNGSSVFVGIDLGVKSDSSAVVAVGWRRATKQLVTAFHRIWRPTRKQPVNLDEVKEYIREIHRLHHVNGIYADPSQCFLLIQQLQQVGIKVKEFPQTVANTTKMGETLFSLVRDKNLIAYKSAELREHVLNAVGVETPSGVRMVKGKSSKKIDAAISLAMACVAAVQMPVLDTKQIIMVGERRTAGGPDGYGTERIRW